MIPLPLSELAGLFAILFVSLESDDRDTASAVTAAGLLAKYTFLPFALIAWLVVGLIVSRLTFRWIRRDA